MTLVLDSSQGLLLFCSRSHSTWRCLCHSSAVSHIFTLPYCYISDAALVPSMFSIELLSHIAIQFSLRTPSLPLQLHSAYHMLLRHYRILQVWKIPSNLDTLSYYSLSPPHSTVIHHRLAMLIPSPPHPHRQHLRTNTCRHTPTNTCRHHGFPGQNYYAISVPHSALIHHQLARLLTSHPHPHLRHPLPHTHRHYWFPGPSSGVQSMPIVASWRWWWHLC